MDSIKLLEKIVDKKNVLLTDRGNSSILLALKLAKQIGKKRILIQDQGGWITYKQFAKRLKLEVEEIKTDYGLVAIKEIEENIGKDCAILLNSMPAYSYMIENIDALYEMCKRRDALLINDVSGSIGDEIGKYGDIILGSFGHWKPIELGKGGFLATDNDHFFRFFIDNLKKEISFKDIELQEKIMELESKRKRLFFMNEKVKKDLESHDIIHKDKKGFNVIVKLNKDKEKIISYCEENDLEYFICPHYMKVKEDAISIEVQRK